MIEMTQNSDDNKLVMYLKTTVLNTALTKQNTHMHHTHTHKHLHNKK